MPTLAEAGAAAFDSPIWYGLWAPVGTPAGRVRELSESIARVLTNPALRGRLQEDDADVMRMSQTDFAQFVLSGVKAPLESSKLVAQSRRSVEVLRLDGGRQRHRLGRGGA